MFQTILENLLREIDDARWAVLAGTDGELLDSASSNGNRARLEAVVAEYARVLKACQKVLGETDIGELVNLSIEAREGKLLLHRLTRDYFLLIGLGSRSYTGKARFAITKSQEQLQRELLR